jgi:phosphoenolpyruvate carboxylase
MTYLTDIKSILGKPYADLELLLNLLADVLKENNEADLSSQIPWIADNEPDFEKFGHNKLLHLFSICFQLLNLAEVNGAVQNRRMKQEEDGLGSVNGLWGNIFNELKLIGADEKTILDHFSHVCVEPVLTAHPTEAKRPVVLRLYRELYLLLVKRENSMYTSFEQEEIKHEIKKILHKLWFIGEIFIEKPAVESELENVLHYFCNVFPKVVHYLDFKLRQAWQNSGFDPKFIEDTGVYPGIAFGNWVGGDRDGHPLVTSEMTCKTLRKFRLHALKLVHTLLEELSEKLSIYCDGNCLLPTFRERMEFLENEQGKTTGNKNYEPFKNYVELLKQKLPIHERPGGGIDLMDSTDRYKNPDELEDDLLLLKSALQDFGAASLARFEVQFVLRHLKVFGFHLVHLDIRQNSKYYEEAFFDIVKISLPSSFEALKNSRRLFEEFIHKELSSNRPFLNRIEHLQSGKAHETLETFQALAGHIRTYSQAALGSLIVSMTRNVSDLLIVYLFMREAGLSHYSPGELVCPLPVVPLFETIDDLMNSSIILDEFLSHPVTRNSL